MSPPLGLGKKCPARVAYKVDLDPALILHPTQEPSVLGWARLGLAQPAEHSWAPPAFSGFVWLCGCTWLPYRCSHTTLKPIAPIPDSGTCLCTNPDTPPGFPITDILEKLRTMEPESTPPCPHPFPFPSSAFPRMRRQTNRCFLDRGCFILGLGLPGCPAPCAPIMGGHQVCRVWPWGKYRAVEPLPLTSFPALLPLLSSAL